MIIKEAYQPRNVKFSGHGEHGGLSLKIYEIAYGDKTISQPRYKLGFDYAAHALRGSKTFSEAELGFLIFHEGKTGSYLVLCYWANENECFVKVFVNFSSVDSQWRAAEDESFCVWDLELISAERDYYIKHVLGSPGRVNKQIYLDQSFVNIRKIN